MPDQTIVDAGKTLIDTGVIGAVLILVIGALIWVVRQWLKALDAKDQVKDQYREATASWAAITETVKQTMQTQISTTKEFGDKLNAFDSRFNTFDSKLEGFGHRLNEINNSIRERGRQ